MKTKKAVSKRLILPPWVAVIVIALVVVVVAVIYWLSGRSGEYKISWAARGRMQKMLDEGYWPGPAWATAEDLRKKGLSIPANFDEAAAKSKRSAGNRSAGKRVPNAAGQ